MADEELNMIMDNLDEFVYDQGKVVTSKWLSISLNVNQSMSQNALENFVERQTKNGKSLDITYFISGTYIDNGNAIWKCKVVNKDQLQDFKSSCENIMCENIYSIQQSLLKNSGTIYSSMYDATMESLSSDSLNKWNNITSDSKKRIKNSLAINQILKVEAPNKAKAVAVETELTLKTEVTAKPTNKVGSGPSKKVQPSSFFGAANKSKSKNKIDTPTTASESKPISPITTIETKDKTDKKEKTNSVRTKTENVEKKIKEKSEKNSKKEKKIVKEESLSKIESVRTTKKKHYPPVVAEETQDSDDSEFGNSDDSGEGFESFVATAKKSGNSKSTQKEDCSNSNESTTESKKATSKPSKKKRKIKEKHETPDSDNTQNNITPSLTPTPSSDIQPTQTEKQSIKRTREPTHDVKQRKRRRILKSKTSMNDDGYMVTEKVYESESFSENSDADDKNDEQTKKTQVLALNTPDTKTTTSKTTSETNPGIVKKKAQSSLTSFFKKK